MRPNEQMSEAAGTQQPPALTAPRRLEVVVNLYRRGLSYREIARESGVPLSCIGPLVTEGRRAGLIIMAARKRGPPKGRKYGPRILR